MNRIVWSYDKKETFTASKDGYDLRVLLGGWFTYWDIKKDGSLVEVCYHHPMVRGELQAKAQAERVLMKILNNPS